MDVPERGRFYFGMEKQSFQRFPPGVRGSYRAYDAAEYSYQLAPHGAMGRDETDWTPEKVLAKLASGEWTSVPVI